MQNKSLLRSMVMVSVVWLLLLALTISQAQEDNQPVFRIGVFDSPRGPIASGAQLAVREINSAGGVTGADGTRFRLELVVESTAEGDTLDEAISAIDAADIIAVLGPATTEEVLSNLPTLQSLGVPMLTPATGDTLLTSDITQTLFRTRAAERMIGAALADYLINTGNTDSVTTIQLDRSSTAARVGFSFALGQLVNNPRENILILEAGQEINALVEEIIDTSAPVVVAYGPPDLAADFYKRARDAGWVGTFAYDQVNAPLFREGLTLQELSGIISTTTWPLAAVDGNSTIFMTDFVRTLGRAPGEIEAATYDSVYLIAAAIGQPGDLLNNLNTVQNIQGVQGILKPEDLQDEPREISDNVAIIKLNALGGPDLVARYAGNEQLPEDTPADVVIGEGTALPSPTATPDGVVITIESAVQNVRTGPGLEYEVLGQLRQGEQQRVIGATLDFSWVIIDYRGQQGWLATYLLNVFGDRSGVPVIAAPPTPTPPPFTNTPPPPPQPDIIIVSASPAQVNRNLPTEITITVRNAGSTDAGPFAIAATFPPSSSFTSANLAGLAAGQQQSVTLPVTITGATGNYNVAIVADLNSQVNEGPTGEANNTSFVYNYRLDQPLFLLNSSTLTVGTSIDLDPGSVTSNDLQYSASGLNTVGTCDGSRNCIGLISPALTWDTAHYDAITSANGVNAGFISNGALTTGSVLGVLTADGRRAVLRVDAINPGISVTFTYRVYQD